MTVIKEFNPATGTWDPILVGVKGDKGDTGAQGPTGATGPPGTPGVGTGGLGVPTGGTTGQQLVKRSATDGDMAWTTVTTSGSGPMPSTPYLNPTTGFVYAADSTDLTVTGSRRWTAKVRLPADFSGSAQHSIASHRGTTTSIAWQFSVAFNTLYLRFSEDGATNVVTSNLGSNGLIDYVGKVAYVRADFDIATHTVTGYVSPDGTAWTALNAPKTGGTPGAPMFDSNQAMTIGRRASTGSVNDVFGGYIYWVQMDALTGGTPSGTVFRWDAAENSHSTASFTDPRGRTWTLNTFYGFEPIPGTTPGERYTNTDTGTTWRWDGTTWTKLTNVIDVRDYGAKGDGVTDDTAAIQQAINDAEGPVDIQNLALIDAIPPTRRGFVHLRGGTYVVSNTILLGTGITLVGDGRVTTCIRMMHSNNKDVIRNRHFEPAPTLYYVQEPGGPDGGVGLKDIRIDGGWRYNDDVTTTAGSATVNVGTYRRSGGGFHAKDVGAPITVFGAGTGGADLTTTIAAVNGIQSITLATPAVTAITAGRLEWGNFNNTGVHFYVKTMSFENVEVVNCGLDNICTEDIPGGGLNDWLDAPEGSCGGMIWLNHAKRNNLRINGNHDNMWPSISASRAGQECVYINNAGYEFDRMHVYSAGPGYPVVRITSAGKIRCNLIIAETTTLAPCLLIDGHSNQIDKVHVYNMRAGAAPGAFAMQVSGDMNKIGQARIIIDNVDMSGLLITGDQNYFGHVTVETAAAFTNTVQCYGVEVRGRYTHIGHVTGNVGSGANSALVAIGRDPAAGGLNGCNITVESHFNPVALYRTRASSADYYHNRYVVQGYYQSSLGQQLFAANNGAGGVTTTPNFRTDGKEYYDIRGSDVDNASTVFVLSSNQMTNGPSAWNGGHITMGAYHLWVDATGKLRIKNAAPTSDTDGTVVGTQT